MSFDIQDGVNQIYKVFWDVWKPKNAPAQFPDDADAEGNFTPPSAPLWARATIIHADGFQASLTGPLEEKKRHTRLGTVIIQVFGGPRGTGSTAAYDAAQDVMTAYEKARGLDVWFRRVRINEVRTRGPHVQVNVKADFSYDDVR